MELARRIEAALRPLGTAERAAQEKRYLKSELVHLGLTVPVMRAATRPFAKQVTDRDALVATVDALWARGIYECRAAAVELLIRRGALLSAKDLPWLERLLRDSHTWALVDAIAPHVVGKLTGTGATLDRWARADDFWLRRTALLASRHDWPRFARYADAMLEETEFFIRKAIGWVLREISKREPDRVYTWLVPRAHRAAGLTLREATKYLPAAKRTEIIARARRAEPARRPTRPARRGAAAAASRSKGTPRPPRRPGDRARPDTRRA